MLYIITQLMIIRVIELEYDIATRRLQIFITVMAISIYVVKMLSDDF